MTSNTESELQLEQSTDSRTDEEKVASVSQTILEAELDCVKKELRELKEQQVYQRTRYSVATMDSMESWESMKGESSRLGWTYARSFFFLLFFPSDVFFLSFSLKKLISASHLK